MFVMRGSRNFGRGGGGGGGGLGGGLGQSDKKALMTRFFFSFLFFSPQLYIEVNLLISKKTIIFQGCRGGPTFSRGGGVSTFSREVQLLIAYRDPYNL